MVKTKQSSKLQKRDWAIIVLFLAVLGTNWLWYQHHQAQELSLRSGVESWLQQQVQINKLKACVDEDTKPCDTTLQIQQ
jgi:hypothetical protein